MSCTQERWSKNLRRHLNNAAGSTGHALEQPWGSIHVEHALSLSVPALLLTAIVWLQIQIPPNCISLVCVIQGATQAAKVPTDGLLRVRRSAISHGLRDRVPRDVCEAVSRDLAPGSHMLQDVSRKLISICSARELSRDVPIRRVNQASSCSLSAKW